MNLPYANRLDAGRLLRLLTVVLLVALPTLSGCMGCNDEELETDPTQTDATFEDPGIDDVRMDDDPFADSGTDTGGVDSEDVGATDTPVVLSLEDVFFGFDEFDLDADARATLSANARLLRDNPGTRLLIEGHCDERGTVQYNLALGEKRANEVKRYLVTLGIGADRIDVVSYGKERPFALGSGEAVWSQNRRAHFVQRGGGR